MAAPAESSRTVICIGDVHGYHSKLLRLWSNLQSSLPPSSFSTALVIFLGDYCDRGPHTRQVLDFLVSLPRDYPFQRHVFLCGNHDMAFAAFVGALPVREDWAGTWRDTWREYEQNEEREGWYKGEGFEEMHVQGRRWGGDMGGRFNAKKGTYYQGSIYDSRLTFESYGVSHGSPDLVKAVPEEHKKFLRDLLWVHEEDDVEIDTEDGGRMRCKLIAIHAGLEKTKNVEERLQVLRARDTSLPVVEELRGRKNVWEIPKLSEKPIMVVSGHHGKLHIDGLRFIIDESGGLEHLHMAAIIFPSKQIVRDYEG